MQMPFERLMEYAASLGEADRDKGMGELAARVGETAARLADAVTAVRVLAGERTYVSPAEIRASEEAAVRRALARDRGTIVSGSSG
jgi:hypothetical protein